MIPLWRLRLKIIEVEKKETLENIDNIGPNWMIDTIHYILTFLANLSSGCLIAEWSKTKNRATWFYSTAPCTSLIPGYLGAGAFRIRFKNESSTSKLLAIFFSNKQEIGHWIKLQVIE